MSLCYETPLDEALHLVRLPGEFGPMLRCMGPLTITTVEALRRELELLLPLRDRALVLNLTGCRALDADGVLLLLDTYRRVLRSGKQLVIVAAREPASRILQDLGIDSFIPVFPTEGAASLALRGGEPEAATATWDAARRATLARWELILRCVDNGELARAVEELALPQALCSRAEELAQLQRCHQGSRCHLCPLFYALGGQSEDLECRSVREPLLLALQAGEADKARRLAYAMVQTLRHLDDHRL